ncbi:homocysteine S-methyltransferase, partial [Oscillochloris sp. ZM17-4]|uniref:homocysteine S-methyltransferase n=1 Tax=Oscillochloris sp. ZM17-4 TaxID=2866714 RepID=UPI001C72D19A
MNPIATILQSHRAIILDGALATELERRECDLNDPLWSARVLLESPSLIRQVHADYFAAGADCAITASYQATFPGFARRGLGAQAAADLMRRSVRIAAEARDAFWADEANRAGRPRPIVAASVGPYGAFLHDGSEYRGDYGLSEEELIAFHRPRMAVLAGAGADILAVETIPCLSEAVAITRLLEEFPDTMAWVSFSAKDAAHICHGEPFAECAALIGAHPQVAAVGVNCTPPQFVAELIAAARAVTDTPLLAYPNSGEVYSAENNSWSGVSECAAYGALAREWYEAGAR